MRPKAPNRNETVPVRYPRPRYQCKKCHAVWEHKRPQPTACPRCGEVLVKWLNSGFWTGGQKDGDDNSHG